jgi:GNAT superfamily N-acetyltransferase
MSSGICKSLHIRIATYEDFEFLVSRMEMLVLHVQRTSQDVYLSRLEETYTEKFAPWFEEAINSESYAVFVAENGRNCVGFVMGEISGPFIQGSKIKKIGKVDLCWVEPPMREKGVASALVKTLERWFKDKNIEYAELQYLTGNSEAENAWGKMGYKPYRIASRKKL